MKLSVYLNESLEAELAARQDGPGDRVMGTDLSKHLERYFELMRRERTTLRRTFSDGEIGLICDACNGTSWEPVSIPFLPGEIDDALGDGLAEKWEVDGTALVAKLQGLCPGEKFALVDAVERFWNGGNYGKTDVKWSEVLK